MWARIKAKVLGWFGYGTCQFCKKWAKDITYQEITVTPIGKIKSNDKMCKACGQRIETQLNLSHTKANEDSK